MLHQYWLRGITGSTKTFVEQNGYVIPWRWDILFGEHPYCDGVGGTLKFWDDDEEKECALLLSKLYFEEGWLYEFAAGEASGVMILVDERQVEKPETMEPWEKASEHIIQANKVGVTRCGCRVRHGLYNKCPHVMGKPMIDVCILMDDEMEIYIERGAGKLTTKEDTIDTLWYGLDNGLVSTTLATSSLPSQPGFPNFICQCCNDCCHILGTYTKLGLKNMFHKSNFDPRVDLKKCTFEEEMLCAKACPIPGCMWHHWPTLPDGSDSFIGINLETCIGCGLCATMCPQKAIKMVKTRNWVPSFMGPGARLEFIDKPAL
jgi:NAD-dependent dihydropyrimidine dehydrogenase PreA subunit